MNRYDDCDLLARGEDGRYAIDPSPAMRGLVYAAPLGCLSWLVVLGAIALARYFW